jgi:ankyrin repeat protein
MKVLQLLVTLLLAWPAIAAAERVAITLDQAIDAADLIVTGELTDLKRVDNQEPPKESNTSSIVTTRPIRWEASFRIKKVLKGSLKSTDSIQVAGLEYPMSFDRPTDFNRLPRTGSIWFVARKQHGFYAVVNGDMVMEDSDANRAAIDFYIRSRKGLNALFSASTSSQVHAAIRNGVDVNATNYFGNTALHVAVKNDRIKVVAALLDGGAKWDLTVVNPLDVAIDLGREPIITLLKSKGVRANGLFLLSDKPLRDYEYFLEQGADVNAGAAAGYTPLTRIISSSESDVKERVSWLLDHGAVASLPDGSYDQAMIEAVHCTKSTELVELLLRHGARVNATDERGWTALVASLSCTPTTAIIELLVSHGADVNVIDCEGWTPLVTYLSGSMDAASIDIVKILLSAGANPKVVVKSLNKSAIDIADGCSAWSEKCRTIGKLLNTPGQIEPSNLKVPNQ